MKILVAFAFILLISNAVGFMSPQHTGIGSGFSPGPSLMVFDENDNKVLRRFLIFSN